MSNSRQTQAYLGLALGGIIVALVVTGTIEPYPASWKWTDSADWFGRHFTLWAALGALYYPVIFGIQFIMKDKAPFNLGGARSNGINWIFWWETGLAIFSIVGAYFVVPACLKPFMEGKGWVETFCSPGVVLDENPSVCFWVFVFCISKVFEFGDTLFIVFRKKPLIVLQHYHHLCTMLVCWGSCALVLTSHNNTVVYFAGMNLTVHSIMYTWYAATRTGWRSPKPLMMGITLLQLVQMVGGVSITLTAKFSNPGCPDPITTYELLMYMSYLFLFAQLFYRNYVAPKKKKREKKP